MTERDVVARAKAALEGVSAAPWEVELEDGQPIEHQHYQYDSTDEWYDVDGPNGGWLAHCQDIPDARFIAEARSLVPELVAELERHRAFVQAVVTKSERGVCPVCSYLFSECTCGVADQGAEKP